MHTTDKDTYVQKHVCLGQKGWLAIMDNFNTMVRLRQLCIAFLLATIVIGIFSFMGMRGTRRNEILNEQFIGAFKANRELLLSLKQVEFQVTMVGIEYSNNGFASENSLQRCKNLITVINDRFEVLANEAEEYLSVYAQYYEFFPLMHQLELQVAVLEMGATQNAVEDTLRTVADLVNIASELNKTLEKIMSEKAESDSHLQSVSLGLIAVITLLVIVFSLPIMFLPRKPPKRSKCSKRDNLYYFPKEDPSQRGKPRPGKL
mgnify:FL=1